MEYFTTDKKRYETKGINERMDIKYRLILWNLIDELKDTIHKDYLQVFEFSIVTEDGKQFQNIVHSQEVPKYSCKYRFELDGQGIKGKVFVVDDGDHCTMLWADEY